jgi:hypothetical protein
LTGLISQNKNEIKSKKILFLKPKEYKVFIINNIWEKGRKRKLKQGGGQYALPGLTSQTRCLKSLAKRFGAYIGCHLVSGDVVDTN